MKEARAEGQPTERREFTVTLTDPGWPTDSDIEAAVRALSRFRHLLPGDRVVYARAALSAVSPPRTEERGLGSYRRCSLCAAVWERDDLPADNSCPNGCGPTKPVTVLALMERTEDE